MRDKKRELRSLEMGMLQLRLFLLGLFDDDFSGLRGSGLPVGN